MRNARGDDVPEVRVARDRPLDRDVVHPLGRRDARPQDHPVGQRIAARHAVEEHGTRGRRFVAATDQPTTRRRPERDARPLHPLASFHACSFADSRDESVTTRRRLAIK